MNAILSPMRLRSALERPVEDVLQRDMDSRKLPSLMNMLKIRNRELQYI